MHACVSIYHAIAHTRVRISALLEKGDISIFRFNWREKCLGWTRNHQWYTSYEGPAAYATTSIRLPSSVPSFHHPLLVHYLLDQITLSWTSPCLSPALSDQNHWRMPTRET